MYNKTEVFDPQREIAELKRRVGILEQRGMSFGKVTDWPEQAPIFGPQDVPFDAYKINLSGYQTSKELLEKMDELVAKHKDNK